MALPVRHSPKTNRRLRVLLDARKLGDGGIGVYIENLIEGMLCQPEIELSLITKNPEEGKRWRELPHIIDTARSYSADEMFRLSKRIPFSSYDLFHVPHYTLPYGINIPTVITVHDLIHIKHPEKFYYPLIAKRLVRSGISRASKVVTVSYSSFHQIAQFMGANSPHLKKISVVHNALDPDFLDPQGKLKISTRGGRPYFLCLISNIKPHKGLDDVLKAFEELRRTGEIPAEIGLVLAGQGAGEIFLNPELHERIQRIGNVDCRGCVTKDELVILFREALALVVGSKAEGFCLPMLEAKASGIPVICRPVPALLELVTDSDIVSSNFSVDSLKLAIKDFFAAEEALRRRAARGIDVSKYDRVALSAKIADVYSSAIAQEAKGK